MAHPRTYLGLWALYALGVAMLLASLLWVGSLGMAYFGDVYHAVNSASIRP